MRLISAVSALEASMVIESELRDDGGRELDLLLHKAQITISWPPLVSLSGPSAKGDIRLV